MTELYTLHARNRKNGLYDDDNGYMTMMMMMRRQKLNMSQNDLSIEVLYFVEQNPPSPLPKKVRSVLQ